MTTTAAAERATRTYRAKATGRHAITLPADLCRRLNIETGDVVELELIGEQAVVRRAPEKPIPPARGLLRGYFKDWEDINRFVQEERQAWVDREERLFGKVRASEQPEGV
ncbi:MAG: AbrB/MazE/SpoVT family DNA-binding domain-containing protein [Thermomicrobiales bacterium]